MPYKLAQLTVNPEHKSDILSRIFTSQPSMEEEQILGKLFVLLEIKNQKTDIMLANFIIDRINLFYYQNEQTPLLARLATITVNDIFENSLAKLNQEIVNFTQAEKLSFNPQDFNITIGVIFKNKLYFASLGHNKALLIYKSKVKNNRQINDYNLMNITASTADPTQEIVLDNKLFTNTIVGVIPPEGYIIFTNESLYEFLSEKQLVKIITTLPPAGAAEQIKNILEQTNIYMPFVGLIIKNQQLSKPADEWGAPVIDPRVKAEPSPVHHAIEPNRRREQDFRQERDLNKESIKALNRTVSKTAQILRPPGFINLEKIKKLLPKIKLPTSAGKQNKLIVNRSDLSWLKREGVISLKKIGSGLLKIFSIIFRLASDGLRRLTDRRERQTVVEKVSGLKQRLGRKHLIVLGVAAFCLLAFAFSLYFTGVQKDKRLKETAWSEAKDQFEQKNKEIEADLVYENNSKAQLSLEEMTTIINQLKNNAGTKHAQELQDLTKRYQALVDRISGLVRLPSPEKIWSLPSGQTADSLAWLDNRLYLASSNNQNLTQFDLNSKNSQTIISNEANLRLLNTDRDGNLWLLGQSKLFTIDKAGKVSDKSIDNLGGQVLAANVYNSRLYLFDGAAKQVFRYQISGISLSSPSPWLQSTITDKINDLGIDTSIYLLGDSQIFKYDAGAGGALTLENIFPSLTQAKKLVAPAGTDLLAVLEPSTKRLIIFSRAGKLLGQYTSDQWQDLKGLTITPDGKTAYLLNGSDVYKVSLTGAKK